MEYMLDTNIISHLIREQPNVKQHLLSVPMESICISAVTEGELLFGLAKRPEAKRLHLLIRELLKRVEVLPWDTSVTERYGMMKAQMESKGKILSPLDLLIAGHALSVGAVLVTNDKAFNLVDGLHVEDWTK